MKNEIKEIIAERIKYHSNKEKYGYFIGKDCIDICASDILDDVIKAGYRKQSETVKEFIRALKEMVSDPSGWITCKCQDLHYDIDKLAKAYGAEVESSLVVAKDLGIQTIMADDMKAFEKAKKELKEILEVEQ